MQRRDFLRLTGTAAGIAASGRAPSLFAQAPRPKPIAVILYTLREQMQADFEGTLRRVAEIGYPAVEFAGYYGRSAEDIRRILDGLNLRCCGGHEGIGGLEKDAAGRCAFLRALGAEHITVPSLPGDVRKQGRDGYLAFAERLNAVGRQTREAGCTLCYHNHAFEFEPADGKPLYEWMVEATDPQFVKLEVDVYWVARGGLDPAGLIRKYADRTALLHMKDMHRDSSDFAPVGTGRLDTPGIVKAGQDAGAAWYIVEQDRCQGSPFDVVATGLKTLDALL